MQSLLGLAASLLFFAPPFLLYIRSFIPNVVSIYRTVGCFACDLCFGCWPYNAERNVRKRL